MLATLSPTPVGLVLIGAVFLIPLIVCLEGRRRRGQTKLYLTRKDLIARGRRSETLPFFHHRPSPSSSPLPGAS